MWLEEICNFSICTFCSGSGGPPPKNFENQECRRSHIRSFCKVFKVSNIPALCLFARGEYRFTVYIENRYWRIDICINLRYPYRKKISIIHVNDKKCLFKHKIDPQVQKLRQFFVNSNQNAQFITDFFVLITWVGPTTSSVFFIGDPSLVGETPSGVRNWAYFQIITNLFVLITRFEVLLRHRSSYWRSILGWKTTIVSAKFG